jgi:hypothetical protein
MARTNRPDRLNPAGGLASAPRHASVSALARLMARHAARELFAASPLHTNPQDTRHD